MTTWTDVAVTAINVAGLVLITWVVFRSGRGD